MSFSYRTEAGELSVLEGPDVTEWLTGTLIFSADHPLSSAHTHHSWLCSYFASVNKNVLICSHKEDCLDKGEAQEISPRFTARAALSPYGWAGNHKLQVAMFLTRDET